MIKRFCGGLVVCLSSVLAAGCSSAAGTAEPSWVRAEIVSPADRHSYEGQGKFYVVAEGARREFGMFSVGPNATNVFSILLRGGTRPPVGDYPLALLDQSDITSKGATAWYTRAEGGRTETFAAISGVLRVTRSTPDRVSGTFQLVGARFCAYDATGPVGACSLPWSPPEGAPTIEVSGEFSVAFDNDEVQGLVPEVPIP